MDLTKLITIDNLQEQVAKIKAWTQSLFVLKTTRLDDLANIDSDLDAKLNKNNPAATGNFVTTEDVYAYSGQQKEHRLSEKLDAADLEGLTNEQMADLISRLGDD